MFNPTNNEIFDFTNNEKDNMFNFTSKPSNNNKVYLRGNNNNYSKN